MGIIPAEILPDGMFYLKTSRMKRSDVKFDKPCSYCQ